MPQLIHRLGFLVVNKISIMRRKNSMWKTILIVAGSFLAGVFLADTVKPMLQKIPMVGDLLKSKDEDENA